MSLKIIRNKPYRSALCSVTLGLVLTACGGGNNQQPVSSSAAQSSSWESSSSVVSSAPPSSSSSVVSSVASSSSSSVVRPSGPPVIIGGENAPSQQPAFASQTDAPGATSSFQIRRDIVLGNNGLSSPWGIEFLPDGRLIVTERNGGMKIVTKSGNVSASISGIPSVFTQGQAGLLDVAVSPNFEQDRLIYFTFAESRDGGQATSAARGRLSNDERRLENVEVIFRQTPVWSNLPVGSGGFSFTIHGHFGSRMAWDFNGNLVITVGERFNEEIRQQAQNLDSLIGKVVRITPEGSVPVDNPFINTPNARPEIWSYGHRNVQAVDIHPITGEVWTVDHGPQGGDEINNPQPGKNYGWPVISYGRNYDYMGGGPIGAGITQQSGLEQPVYYWDPVIAPSGARFYDGNMFPEWYGNLLITGLVSRNNVPSGIARIMFDGDEVIGEERLLTNYSETGRLRDLTIADDGSIWVINDAGYLFKLYR